MPGYGSQDTPVTPSANPPPPGSPLTAPPPAAPPTRGYGSQDTPVVAGGAAPPSDTGDSSDTSPDDSGRWGYTGGATRELAPIAAGATIGAAIGAPFGGIGAIPGAATGAIATGFTEAALGLYDIAAQRFGWPRAITPQDATDWLLDKAGIGRATTTGQRMFQSGVGALGGVLTGSEAAKVLKPRLEPPVGSTEKPGLASKVVTGMQTKPVRQAAGAVVGAEAGQGMRESGIPIISSPEVSTLTSLAFGGSAGEKFLKGLVPGTPSKAAQEAHDAGFVLHPGEISTGQGAPAVALAALGGKVKTSDTAAHSNIEVVDDHARSDLGLRPGTPLNHDTYDQIRSEAGGVYDDVRRAVPRIHTGTPITTETQVPDPYPHDEPGVTKTRSATQKNLDPDWKRAIDNLGNIDEATRLKWPKLFRNPEIDQIKREMRATDSFTPDEALGFIKRMRFDAKANFRARDNPRALETAIAQRQAADAMEALMEKQISQRRDPDLINRWREARQRIAKSWDYEYATYGDHIDPRRLANLTRMNVSGSAPKMLTGGALQIANARKNFPYSINLPRRPEEPLSVLDMAFGIAEFPNPRFLAPAARMAARHSVLSPGFQGYQFNVGRRLGLPPSAGRVPRTLSRTTLLGQGGEDRPGGSLYPYVDGDTGFDALMQNQDNQ